MVTMVTKGSILYYFIIETKVKLINIKFLN